MSLLTNDDTSSGSDSPGLEAWRKPNQRVVHHERLKCTALRKWGTTTLTRTKRRPEVPRIALSIDCTRYRLRRNSLSFNG
jgi:hypothetical protein